MSSETTQANKYKECDKSFDFKLELHHQYMNQERIGNA